MISDDTTYGPVYYRPTRSDIEARILSFGELGDGWHFGEGQAPPIDIIDRAIELHHILKSSGFRSTNAFPGIDGEVIVSAYRENFYLEFTLEVDGSLSFIFEQNDVEEISIEGLTIENVLSVIDDTWDKIWNALGSSNTFKGTHFVIFSKAVHSLTPEVLEESRSLADVVYMNRETQYVLI
jgi:hypothetical protein